MNTFESIPSFDLLQYSQGNAADKKSFVAQLGNAFTEIGFVSVKNHGLTDELEAKLYDAVQQFFALPQTVKQKYEIEGLFGQRGYTSFAKEHAKGSNAGDLKEFWHFGQEVEGNDPIKAEYPENVLVAELPNFHEIGMVAYKRLEETGKTLLRAIALYLNLDEYYFDDKIHNGNSILRPIHYGPISEEPKNAVRAGAHEDINLITLLMGASADGLEILNNQGNWIAVTALPQHLVVNVGDMLQRLTNNKLKSTTHRVINPPKEKWHEPRYSIPFFLHPRSDMRLDGLETCIDANNPLPYEPISAGEYLTQRLQEIGLKKG